MNEKYQNFEEELPKEDQPCEYQIVVTCKGWFRPNGNELRFAADERNPPTALLTAWRPWVDGETWTEGQRLVMEHRKKMQESDE